MTDMKWFWYSLIGFCLLMCSCRTKKMDSNVRIRSDIHSDLSYLNRYVKIDTFKTAYFANVIQNIVIEEDITVTEYDKESGKPIKETKTKRKVAQDTDKVVSEEKAKGVRTEQNDSLKHKEDTATNVETETKEETKGGQEAFGKWLGIVVGFGIVVLIIYLCKKF